MIEEEDVKVVPSPQLNPNATSFISTNSVDYYGYVPRVPDPEIPLQSLVIHHNGLPDTASSYKDTDSPTATGYQALSPTLSFLSSGSPQLLSSQSSPEYRPCIMLPESLGGGEEVVLESPLHGDVGVGGGGDQSSYSDDSPLTSDDSAAMYTRKDLVTRVRKQLEYYFSLENLATDQYLVSQMDGDQFVPIWTVANFNAVKKLTTDIDVIKEALMGSKEVQIDVTRSKVRPIIKRCTLILRDVSQKATAEEITALFNKSPDCPQCMRCTFAHNNSWFVEFRTEHEALQAYQYFREHPHYFHGDLIKVRIKARPLQRSSPSDSTTSINYAANSNMSPNSLSCYPHMVPMVWVPSTGMVPVDMNYHQSQYHYYEHVPYPEYPETRYRTSSADSFTRRRSKRGIGNRYTRDRFRSARYNNNANVNSNNNSNSNNNKHNNNSTNDSPANLLDTRSSHKRNDSDDSTVSSASSYNVTTASPKPPHTCNDRPSTRGRGNYHHRHIRHKHYNNGPGPRRTFSQPHSAPKEPPKREPVSFTPSHFPPLSSSCEPPPDLQKKKDINYTHALMKSPDNIRHTKHRKTPFDSKIKAPQNNYIRSTRKASKANDTSPSKIREEETSVNSPSTSPAGKLTYSQIASKSQPTHENAINGIASSDDDVSKKSSKSYKDVVASKPVASPLQLPQTTSSISGSPSPRSPVALQAPSRNFNSSSSDTTIKSPTTPTWTCKNEQAPISTSKNESTEWIQSRYKTLDYKKSKRRDPYLVDGELHKLDVTESFSSKDSDAADEPIMDCTVTSQPPTSGKQSKQINWFEDNEDDDNLSSVEIDPNPPQSYVISGGEEGKPTTTTATTRTSSSSSDLGYIIEDDCSIPLGSGGDVNNDKDSSDHDSIPSPSCSETSEEEEANEVEDFPNETVPTPVDAERQGESKVETTSSQSHPIKADITKEVENVYVKEEHNSYSDYDSDRDEFFSSYSQEEHFTTDDTFN